MQSELPKVPVPNFRLKAYDLTNEVQDFMLSARRLPFERGLLRKVGLQKNRSTYQWTSFIKLKRDDDRRSLKYFLTTNCRCVMF